MLSFFAVPLLALSAVSASTPAARSISPVIGTWYAGWHATEGFPLSSISWGKYNTLYYSFATTTPSVGSLSLDGSNGELLPQFVSDAHAHGVAAHIAIGGWTGGRWFSSNVATQENRTAFVKTVTDFAHKYNLDGLQIDWEYPNRQGVGCNTISADDTANLLEFLQELRQNSVGKSLTLSAAVSVTPFRDASGKPSTDVSGFAKVFDYITIMNYDVWGSWSSGVGPNAPLNDTCASSANQQGSAVSAVKAWTEAGIPVNQIVLGVASYGHSFSVAPPHAFKSDKKTLAVYPAFNASNQPLGDVWDNVGGDDGCGVYQGPGGTFRFWGLMDEGFLTKEGIPAHGIHHRYDDCSQTPYVYNETSHVMVSFDNTKSFAAKGHYIKKTGLRGFTMWEAGGDYNDMLLESITKATGY
ncbi:glycoside hydrolase family 18 protein [Suillus paluster]|uniref:glycoside hydrolase family 18 protein n=1 Tax=Suillus paluster TaxID=48578 RepID=UPI001B85C164|nr:glycoside hydrolase family 18 protein [Suillus paluster]KAG1737910.1 glycoside hydrolase family 18 protein [Suillus paluster]